MQGPGPTQVSLQQAFLPVKVTAGNSVLLLGHILILLGGLYLLMGQVRAPVPGQLGAEGSGLAFWGWAYRAVLSGVPIGALLAPWQGQLCSPGDGAGCLLPQDPWHSPHLGSTEGEASGAQPSSPRRTSSPGDSAAGLQETGWAL